jgi:hypothetical protein
MPAISTSDRVLARTVCAVLIFIVCCLVSSARLVMNAAISARRHDTVAQNSDERFAPLKAALPDRGVVGYIGEAGNSGTADYYLAQYALAPLVVENSPDHALVVANFPRSKPDSVPRNLELVTDFGNGVLLFRNPSAKDAR